LFSYWVYYRNLASQATQNEPREDRQRNDRFLARLAQPNGTMSDPDQQDANPMAIPLIALTDAQRELATAHFEILRPFLQQRVPLTHLAQQHQLPLRTLSRWVQRYRAEGLAGLVRKRRADHGRHRLNPMLQQLIEGLALQNPPLSIAAIHRQVSELARQHDLQPLSYGLVHTIVKNLSPALTTLAHQGAKAYGQQYDLLYRREADAPNAIWQADHCLLDILVLREGQQPIKPWLTVILDDYSRAMPGYFLTFDAPSALNTSLALHQAIWRKDDPRWRICGIPQTLFTDCGSDFKSRHLEQVSVDLKIRLINSIPGQPRGRGRIERFFLTVQQMLLCELPGYAPPKGAVRDEPRLTLNELDSRFRAFVFDTYHERPHSETNVPPRQRWEAGGFLPQMPESLEQLDLLLLTVAKPRKVRRDGLWFQGLRYMDPTLAAYVGESVILRYDPRDVAEVRVFYAERFLCRAICQELAGASVPLRDIIKARNRHRRDLRQILREREQVVESLLAAHRGESRAAATSNCAVSPEAGAASVPEPQAPRLKRYFNE
jgi:putative transposase